MTVLPNGSGFVFKRVVTVPRSRPVRPGPISANPAQMPCICFADEARMVGTVLWVLRRV